MSDRIWIVEEDDGCDVFVTRCVSEEAAIKEAKNTWNHLTKDEKEQTHVIACSVSPAYFDEENPEFDIWDVAWDSGIRQAVAK